MLADPVEQLAGGAHGRQRVRCALLGREQLACLGSGATQRVGEAEPGLLGGQRVVLAGLWVDLLHLGEPEPQKVGLAGPLASRPHHLGQLGFGVLQSEVVLGEPRTRSEHLLAREPVERLALGRRPEEPVLVGLPVHGDQRVGHRGQRADRDGRPAGERA